MKKKLLALAMALVVATCSLTVAGCKKKEESKEKLVVAYQSSIAYAPIIVMMNQEIIEKNYKEATGKEIEVDWQLMANGAAINDGIVAGQIDIGTLGAAPAITGMQAGIPYKIFSGISSQPYGILTNDDSINSLADIKDDQQIAITNINSQPHILLAMAAKAELGDAHKLDNNLTVLANADGYAALTSGAVACHMVISPYNFMEEQTEGIHNIEIGEDIWPDGNTFIVGVASTKLEKDNPELYKVVCDSMEDAMEYIKANPEETAELLSKEYDATKEEILEWMSDPGSQYETTLQGVMDLANFMKEAGFSEQAPSDLSEIAFSNVKGN